MTQYDRLMNGSATHASIAAEVAEQVARKPLYKRIPAHILVEDFLAPNNLEVRDVVRMARIHPTIMNKFIRGEARITDEMAIKFGSLFRTGPNYWHDVQAAYDNGKL